MRKELCLIVLIWAVYLVDSDAKRLKRQLVSTNPFGNITVQPSTNSTANATIFNVTSTCLEQAGKNFLNFLNVARLSRGLKKLKLNSGLAATAQTYAQQYVQGTLNVTSCKGVSYMSFSLNNNTLNTTSVCQALGQRVYTSWYGEGKNYKYLKKKSIKKFCDFTQSIWKGTKKVGFGASTFNDTVYIVAVYKPVGNKKGKQFLKNVVSIQL